MDDTAEEGRRALGLHFRARSAALVAEWREAVGADPRLKTGTALPRATLEDHLPEWLEALAVVLEEQPGAELAPTAAEAEAQVNRDAEQHGLQRWQQGYDLHEVTREWGHLHRGLVAEIERFAAAHPGVPAAVLTEARLKLAERSSEATSTSAEQYFRLERMEASGNARDLEKALSDIRALERARADLWQQAAHDLRGNLGVVSNVAAGLAFADLPAERRHDFLGRLRNNVEALRHLLDDVTALARLQAGEEQRRSAPFDAAALLQRLCDDMRPLAEARQLTLEPQGPAELLVEGDRVKVRRIAQNLLINALKYTRVGGVTVRWGASPLADDGARWQMSVEDTGPGFHAGPGSRLADALTQATVQSEPGEGAGPGEAIQVAGEGIGLAIVKRLSELLNASVELDSGPGRGTAFRILLPRRYPAPPTV